jgi:hypothetical protein
MLKALPEAKSMIAIAAMTATPISRELAARGTEPCTPRAKSHKKPIAYGKTLYCQRHKIENLFAKLIDCQTLRQMRPHPCPGHRHRSRRRFLSQVLYAVRAGGREWNPRPFSEPSSEEEGGAMSVTG